MFKYFRTSGVEPCGHLAAAEAAIQAKQLHHEVSAEVSEPRHYVASQLCSAVFCVLWVLCACSALRRFLPARCTWVAPMLRSAWRRHLEGWAQRYFGGSGVRGKRPWHHPRAERIGPLRVSSRPSCQAASGVGAGPSCPP